MNEMKYTNEPINERTLTILYPSIGGKKIKMSGFYTHRVFQTYIIKTKPSVNETTHISNTAISLNR